MNFKLNIKDLPAGNLSPEELTSRTTQNNFACYMTMLQMPRAYLQDDIRGLQIAVTGRNSFLFNMAMPNADIANLDKEAFTEFKNKLIKEKIPFCVELVEGTPSNIHEFFKNQSPAHIILATSIVLEAKVVPAVPPSAELQFSSVQNLQDLEKFLNIMELVWPDLGEIKNCFKEWTTYSGFGSDKSFQSFIVEMNGLPVGIGSLHFSHGVVTVFNIAVVPEYQKKGIGQFITANLLGFGVRNGYTYFAGSGSAEGMFLYRKANIQELGTKTRYIFAS